MLCLPHAAFGCGPDGCGHQRAGKSSTKAALIEYCWYSRTASSSGIFPKASAACSPSSSALQVSAALICSALPLEVAKCVVSATATDRIVDIRQRDCQTTELLASESSDATESAKPWPVAGPAVRAAATELPM